MSGPELPVIYENPRFDQATPTLQPVVNRAIRFGAALMLEWGTLTLIEDAPRYFKWATVGIAVLLLAVHESWPWLRMRGRYWYPAMMSVLVLAYVGTIGYVEIFDAKKRPQVAQPSADELNVLKDHISRQSQDLLLAQKDARKWNFVFNLRNGAKAANGELLSCKYIVILGSDKGAWDLWTALQPMLDFAHWSVDPSDRSGTTDLKLATGLTILTGPNSTAYTCATALGRTAGDSFPALTVQFKSNQVTSPLNACKNECVELDIGG